MTTELVDAGQAPARRRTPAKRKARELAKHLRAERPDYHTRQSLEIYSRMSLSTAQDSSNAVIDKFPV